MIFLHLPVAKSPEWGYIIETDPDNTGWLKYADVAELADAHGSGPCSARIVGSTPTVGTMFSTLVGFPSGQRGQTVNLLARLSMVRIHLPPPSAKSPESTLPDK